MTSATLVPDDRSTPTNLGPIADLVADGALRASILSLRGTLEAESRMRADGRLSRVHREVLLQQNAASRLEKDSAAGRLSGTDILRETARLSAALLDLIDATSTAEKRSGVQLALKLARLPNPMATVNPGRITAEPCDVFLSYSRPDRTAVVALATSLHQSGISVWYDHKIAGGARFADVIVAQLDAAKAVVVLWSEHAIKSDWVRYEAQRAHAAEKLVPLRSPTLALSLVPPPYPAVLNVLLHGDDEALRQTLAKRGIPLGAA